ncbi:sugar ABC transporter permease [Rathayibacter sp. VKM Ac-2760]|uniref:carbohydrate ABC transporter permease n=1 Tax=Rathayibacter sp. VKM Ac-2760 TaxID=2609253 RepID=UPI001319ACC0|nr:sugar ABC transporter permease [Rathayibacter sp. VKM Ac-2760]QHC57349.1 ABC transporter permease subunit [Rathayibacter sp. VKM Ac-2760]
MTDLRQKPATRVPTESPSKPRPSRTRRQSKSIYPSWFFIPAAALYIVLFAVPTFASLYFSLTRWTLFDVTFIGFDNFIQFFSDPQLLRAFTNTLIFAVVTSVAKVVLGFALAVLLTSELIGRGYLRAVTFFPVLVSTIGIGLTFKALLDPFDGIVNGALSVFGIQGPGWLTDPSLALISVAIVDVWKGLGIATLVYIAGIVAIPQDYFEAARMDGAGSWKVFRNITFPLSWPATGTVIILSLIGGLRSFDLIWAMTKGGPGFSSDVIASVIYKQYQAGFYGLSTAGNVVLFIVVTAVMIPLSSLINKRSNNV